MKKSSHISLPLVAAYLTVTFLVTPAHGSITNIARYRKLLFLGLALACTLAWPVMTARAATRIWLGNTSLWSNPGNWSPSGVPQNGDSLTFPDISPFGVVFMNNDLANLSLDTITFTAGSYTLNGNAITFIQGITDNHVGALNRVNCGVQFTSGGGRFNSIDLGQLEIGGTTTLAGNQDLIVTPLVTNITVSGVIQGNGALVKRGEGALFLRGSGANTYTGPTRVETGELHLAKISAAIAISANVTLDGSNPGYPVLSVLSDDLPGQYPPLLSMTITNGGIWGITNGATVTNLVLFQTGRVEGTGLLNLQCDVMVIRTNASNATFSRFYIGCPIFLGDATRTFSVAAGASELNVRGQIIGPGPGPNSSGIIKTGFGDLYLYATNPYFGPTLIQGGRVYLYSGGALGGSGPGAETTVESGELNFDNDSPMTVPEPLVMNGGSIALDGAVTLTGPVVINFNFDIRGAGNSTLEFTGVISGPRAFDVRGGTVRLSGTAPNTFGSATSVSVEPEDSIFFSASFATLELAKPDNVVAVPARVIVDSLGTNQAILRNLQNGGVSDVTVFEDSSWLLNGHTVAITALKFRGGGLVDTQGGQLQLTEAGTEQLRATASSDHYTAQILGSVACLGPTNYITIENGATLNAPGQVSGSGAIRKEGAGTLRLSGNNTFTGPLTVSDGLLEAGSNNALGATGAGTTVLDGATLQIETNPALGESLTLAGAGRGGTNGALNLFPATGTQAGIVLAGPTTVRVDAQFAILSSAISGTGPLTKVGAGSLQFGGFSPNTYSGDTLVNEGELILNKLPAGLPAVPGHLLIGSGGPAATVRHFTSFGVVGSVTVNRGGLWNLNGFSESFSVPALEGRPPLTLNGGGDVQTGAGTLTLPPGGDMVVNPSLLVADVSSSLSGNLGLDPGPHHFIVSKGLTSIGFNLPALDLTAVISQASTTADIVKEGSGDLRLSGNNSFAGAVTINAGTLIAANNFALGTSAGGVTVNNNASLALEGGLSVVGEPLTLNSTNGAALTSLGAVTNVWDDSPITLQSTAGISVPGSGGGLTLSGLSVGSISGPGGFTKSGSGALFITGLVGGNSYTGPTTISGGLLEATRRPGRSLSGTIVVTGSNSVLHTGRPSVNPTLAANTVLPSGASVTVQDGALWTMNRTNSETVSRLTGDGRVDIGSGAMLTVSNSVSCAFSGIVSNTGALNKRGLATLNFTGQSPSYTGPVTVFDGTYKVDGYFANSPVTVKLSSILRGSGAVGDVTVENGGVVRVDPRNPGVLGGSMQFNSVNFQSGGVFGAQFYGPDPTGGNDLLYVLNGVTLNSSALSSGFGYPPREGDVITLVQKIAAGAVTGAFSSFPEGALRNIGQIPVVTTYVGGNGNEVTLTVTNLPLGGGGSQLVGGTGSSVFVPNDCSLLWLAVTNRGGTTLTNLHGTLRSLTPGVLVTISESPFPNLASNARGTNIAPFQIRTESSFPCGGGGQLELVLTGSNSPPMSILYTLPGASGYHLNFDGRDDEVDVAPNVFSTVANNFTIELWANPTGNRTQTAETNAGISGVSVPLHQLQRFAVFPDRGNLAYGLNHVGAGLSIGRNGISAYEQGTNYLPSRLVYSNAVSGWTHVALVYTSRAPKLYVNGTLVRSGAAGPFSNVHPSGSLGGSTQGDFGNFEGQLDEVRVWNAALSQSQIQSNMTQRLTGTEAGLVTYFRCDEGSGSVLTDSASASPNPSGTLAGGAAFVLSDRAPFTIPGGPACDSGGGACESCFVAIGTFTTNTPVIPAHLSASGSPSVCFPAKSCPGAEENTIDPPLHFYIHSFANSSGTQACVTAQLHFDCSVAPQTALHVAAYLGSLDPNAPCQNYLGDSGGDGTQAFSFPVPAGSNFVILVTKRLGDIGCDDYQLELFGLNCPPPSLAIERDAAPDKVRVHWSTAYPGWQLQSVSDLSIAPSPFQPVLIPPVIAGGRYNVTNDSSGTNQFYRLSNP